MNFAVRRQAFKSERPCSCDERDLVALYNPHEAELPKMQNADALMISSNGRMDFSTTSDLGRAVPHRCFASSIQCNYGTLVITDSRGILDHGQKKGICFKELAWVV